MYCADNYLGCHTLQSVHQGEPILAFQGFKISTSGARNGYVLKDNFLHNFDFD